MIVINKIDAENVNLPALLERIQKRLARSVYRSIYPRRAAPRSRISIRPGIPISLPLRRRIRRWSIRWWRSTDSFMELYLEQEIPITPEQLHAPFEQALRDGHLVPVCFVSAKTGRRRVELLDIFAKTRAEPNGGQPADVRQGRGKDAEEFRAERTRRNTSSRMYSKW